MSWLTRKRREIGARRAQKEGKTFEKLIVNCAHRELIAIKKSDPPLKQAPSHTGKTIFWREKSGADFIIGYKGQMVLFDAKSFDSDKMSFSKLVKHQIDELKYWNDHGFRTGYLVNFRSADIVTFINISCLLSLGPRESIKATDGLTLGTEFSFSLKRLFGEQAYSENK